MSAMQLNDLFQQLINEKPRLIYLSGKTCTGKSTFANELKNRIDYDIIDLDLIVLERVITPLKLEDEHTVFVEVYRNERKRDWVNQFIAAVKTAIEAKRAQHQPTVIDGAVANSNTLAAIFADYPDFRFIYFHPFNIDVYIRNLTNRFVMTSNDFNSGLPKQFWEVVEASEFRNFCVTRAITPGIERSIEQYAKLSQAESHARLANFRERFYQITLVNI
jgi:hypothetical protein